MQQLVDLVLVRRMAEYRQRKCRLGDEQIAALRLEWRAGRVGAALVIAGNDHPAALVFDDELRAAEHMPRWHEPQRRAVTRHKLAIAGRLQGFAGQLAVPLAHDRDRLRRREDMLVAGPSMIAMAVRDHGARHRPRRVDIEIAGFAIEPRRRHPEPAFWPRHKVWHGCDIGAGRGNVSLAQLSSAEIGRAMLSRDWRSASRPIASSTRAAPTISAAPNR